MAGAGGQTGGSEEDSSLAGEAEGSGGAGEAGGDALQAAVVAEGGIQIEILAAVVTGYAGALAGEQDWV